MFASGRDSNRSRRLVPIILLAASLLTVAISTRSLEGLPEEVGISVLGFFQRGFSAVADFFSDTVSSIAELKRLKKDYDALSQKLEEYTKLERDYADLRQENERLKEQLGFADRLVYQKISARIIAKDPENLYASIVINKGSEAGIRKNMPVVAFQNGQEGLVGRVVEVGRGSSIVVPLYDSSSHIAGRLANSRLEGLVSGRGTVDETLVMRYVNKRAKDESQFGDLVVTSGYESIYPPEIAIGRIKRFRTLDYETSIEIDIEPVLTFSSLEYVFVIKTEEAPVSASETDIAPLPAAPQAAVSVSAPAGQTGRAAAPARAAASGTGAAAAHAAPAAATAAHSAPQPAASSAQRTTGGAQTASPAASAESSSSTAAPAAAAAEPASNSGSAAGTQGARP